MSKRRTSCSGLRKTVETQCSVARDIFRVVRVGGTLWAYHNGSYKGKWDPMRVWGPAYWRCCFAPELKDGQAKLHLVDDVGMFMHEPSWDRTYSLVIRRRL